jgi:hypothetical protein
MACEAGEGLETGLSFGSNGAEDAAVEPLTGGLIGKDGGGGTAFEGAGGKGD